VSPSSAVDEGQAACERARACLVGNARAGKTSLAVAMLRRRVWKTGIPGMFFQSHRLGMAGLQHPAGHGEPEIVDQAIRIPLALIDDLGSERDVAMNAVPDVIFDRHVAGRDTWITTGMTREQLVTRYGQGTVARLFEGARVIRLGNGGCPGSPLP
jgi:DNA replication protein DnaC